MTSNSCEAAERMENSINVDRFSNLPDEIAHKIMKGFSFEDLTHVGCVSKRCKILQLSTPFIHLEPYGENVRNMLDSFINFMIQRGDNKIQRFGFECCCSRDITDIDRDKFRLSAWINSAVRCKVEEFSVHLYPQRDPDVLFPFPNVLFLCGSLKSLSLRMKCVIGGEVSFSPSLSNLESLNLDRVSVIDESFWRWISSSCKRLQTLFLLDIYGSKNIIIESPSVKKVRISLREGDCCNLSICANRLEDIYIGCGYTSRTKSVNISTPNAKQFAWCGAFLCHHLGEMRCLNECRISCYREVTEFATLVDVLCSVRWVKTLVLDDCVLRTLSKYGVTFAPLNEVYCLKVTCDLTDELVPGLISLLQRTPSLETLCLNAHPHAYAWNADLFNYGGFDMEFWKQQKLAFVDCLNNIAIALYSGSNAFEFASNLLLACERVLRRG